MRSRAVSLPPLVPSASLVDVTYTSFATVPPSVYLGVDRSRIISAGVSNALYRGQWASTDVGFNANNSLNRALVAGDGELIVTTQTDLRRSTGGIGGTWNTELTVISPDRFHQGWGVDVYDNYVFATTYGTPKPAAFDSYLSQDYGVTFLQVFDLETFWSGEGVVDFTNSHNHGCAIDPYHSPIRLWQLTGDTGTVGWCWSDNLGSTWNLVGEEGTPDGIDGNRYPNCTTITATAQGMVLGTDDPPNGIIFIPRDGNYASAPIARTIHSFDDGYPSSLTHISQCSVRAHGLVFVGFNAAPGTIPGGGATFDEILPSRIVAVNPVTETVTLLWEGLKPSIIDKFNKLDVLGNMLYVGLSSTPQQIMSARIVLTEEA